ncbi:Sensory box histidine kinase [Dissulfuribacter thermophilus]|uniref:histidine kinase n=2 Tax=Dissulfuribacter thermophilus TaxID=1156395 RepID=A0A1B9F755_9BACT|nr:Sensory box histidine kinase [Dissulfuribacter thermophilus]
MIFGLLTFVVFLVVYFYLVSYLHWQIENELLNSIKEFESLYKTGGIDALRSEFLREAESEGAHNVFLCLRTPDGKVVASSGAGACRYLEPLKPDLMNSDSDRPVLRTISPHGLSHKIRLVAKEMEDGYVMEVGRSLKNNELMMERYRETFGAAIFVMITSGGLIGWFMARKAMSGVSRVTTIASRIGKGDLRIRVPYGGEGEEIRALVIAFNDMLGRIESLVKELKHVTDNIAHELRTPLTRIRGLAETTLIKGKDVSEYQELAASVIRESDQLIAMLNTMLEIAKTDSGINEMALEPVDLKKIIEEAIDLFMPLAEEKDLSIEVSLPKGEVIIKGERHRLQRAFANLLDNAIKYSLENGRIEVSLKREEHGMVLVEIGDSGIGIDEKDLPYIFERFYRGDKSRSTPGSGLGLSLSLSIIRAHGGDIQVESAPGKGTKFTIVLPVES